MVHPLKLYHAFRKKARPPFIPPLKGWAFPAGERKTGDISLDFDNNARWRTRSCPSEKALARVLELLDKGYQARVVWLVSEPVDKSSLFHSPYYDESFEECEAIIVENYLGRYTLVSY